MMKRIKLNVAILALLLGATAAFAFKPVEKHVTKFDDPWFIYDNIHNKDLPSSYTKATVTPSCNGSLSLCAIQGQEQGTSGRPTQMTVDNPEAVKDHP